MNDYERIKEVINYLSAKYQEQPRLSVLADVAGLSEYHFHRLFSRWAGVTPKAFTKFLTLNHAKELLRESRALLETSIDCGLSGPGRLHDLFVSVEAVTPGEFKTRGEGLRIWYGFHETPFGDCLIGMTERGVCHLHFCDSDQEVPALEELSSAWRQAVLRRDQEATAGPLRRIFFDREQGGETRLFLVGTPFRLKVWEALLRIPSGCVLSYSDIARWIGQPAAARAVGSAVASNPVAYLIPCHRVIRGTGVIQDYRWGRVRKQALLAWESAPRGGMDSSVEKRKIPLR